MIPTVLELLLALMARLRTITGILLLRLVATDILRSRPMEVRDRHSLLESNLAITSIVLVRLRL